PRRSGPAAGAGDPARVDGEPRLRVREEPPRLPVHAGDAQAAGAAGVLPPEVERAGDGVRRGGGGRALRQGATQAAAGRSSSEDGPHTQGLRRWGAPRSYMDRQRRAGLLFVLPAVVYFGGVLLVPLVESVIGSFYLSVPRRLSQLVRHRTSVNAV